MKRRCVCGEVFHTTQSKLDSGAGKFCSRKCANENRTRRSGLEYNIVAENPAWFKGGEEHPWWKGDDVSYRRLHKWVEDHRGSASEFPCDHCGEAQAEDWANISHEYQRELDDYMPLCKKCHAAYDKEDKARKRELGESSYEDSRKSSSKE